MLKKYIIVFVCFMCQFSIKAQVNIDSVFFDLIDTLHSSISKKQKVFKWHKAYDTLSADFPDSLIDTSIVLYEQTQSSQARTYIDYILKRTIEKDERSWARQKVLDWYVSLYFGGGGYYSIHNLITHYDIDFKAEDFSPESLLMINKLWSLDNRKRAMPTYILAGFSGNKKFIPLIWRTLDLQKASPDKLVDKRDPNNAYAYLTAYCALARLGSLGAAEVLIEAYKYDPYYFTHTNNTFFMEMLFYTRNEKVWEEILEPYIYGEQVLFAEKELLCKMLSKFRVMTCPKMSVNYGIPKTVKKYKAWLNEHKGEISYEGFFEN